jgi:hypothetical protein
MSQKDYILQGGVDLHTHAGPDFYARSVDQIELAEKAKKEKMAAVVLKNHPPLSSKTTSAQHFSQRSKWLKRYRESVCSAVSC